MKSTENYKRLNTIQKLIQYKMNKTLDPKGAGVTGRKTHARHRPSIKIFKKKYIKSYMVNCWIEFARFF